MFNFYSFSPMFFECVSLVLRLLMFKESYIFIKKQKIKS